MLETAHRSNPNCNWWLKGDGCDLVAGLGESIRLEWSGNVDLNTGSLQQLYQSYRSLLNLVASLTPDAVEDLRKCHGILLEEKEFLVKSMCNYKENFYACLFSIFSSSDC